MKVTVRVDQPIWERSTYEVEIPDGLEGDDLTEALSEAVANHDGPEHREFLCHMEHMDDEREAYIDGEVVEF